MKAKIIEALIGIVGALALCMICSEPAEGTSMNGWLLWELGWIAALIGDFKLAEYLDKKGIIKMGLNDER